MTKRTKKTKKLKAKRAIERDSIAASVDSTSETPPCHTTSRETTGTPANLASDSLHGAQTNLQNREGPMTEGMSASALTGLVVISHTS